ncbi:hypothetical protein BJ878DRAFT_538063 [Calycina marina]|uniref:DUF8035 domain-containing protein n=1 Tax=Calycina marina TaxID=1763456 RepID=A0A9P8CJ88_9HELO|nr:hypothetical protein BJ878DRAFT_538063 [Calycina marina]
MSWDGSDDEERFNVRISETRRTGPVHHGYQPEYRSQPVGRPTLQYAHGNSYLVPAHRGHRRSSSSHSNRNEVRYAPSAPPMAAPLIINNRIYNDYDDDLVDDHDRRHHHDHRGRDQYLVALQPRSRSRSHSRPQSFSANPQQEWELEKARKELEAYKLREESEREMEHLKKELEAKRLRDEKRKKEEAGRIEAERREAIEKYKIDEAKRIAKDKKDKEDAYEKFKADEEKKAAREKKEKDDRDKELKQHMEEELRKSGMPEDQIAVIMKKEGAKKPAPAQEIARPTYTRMSRRHLSIETLNVHRIEYEFDVDPDYVLIKRWVPEYEQDFLWKHTRELRESRCLHPQRVVYAIEGKKKHHEEPVFEFVRKKEKRRPSPSPLLTFLAGGKGH